MPGVTLVGFIATRSILPMSVIGTGAGLKRAERAEAAGALASRPTIATMRPRRAKPLIQFEVFTITFDISIVSLSLFEFLIFIDVISSSSCDVCCRLTEFILAQWSLEEP